MNSQIATLAIGVALSQAAKRVNVDQYVWSLRFGYLAVQGIIIAMYLVIARKVVKRNDTSMLKYSEPQAFGGATGQPPTLYITTARNYDLTEVSKGLRAIFMGMGMTGFMHFWLGFNQPLLVSCLTVWIGLYRSKIVRIYLRGQEGQDDLARPFKSGGGLMGNSDPKTDKQSIAEAERAQLLYRGEEF